jgi:PAS domain S-box-containing protein/putative nucleotidyltransferase with HDIG domain
MGNESKTGQQFITELTTLGQNFAEVEKGHEQAKEPLTEKLLHQFLNANREPEYLLGISEYITERKQAKDALRQSEEKYRTILEDIQEGYFEVDFAGNFTFFNDSLSRYFGYSKEELMGMNYRQYTEKEHSKELFQVFNKVYSTGEPTEGFNWQIIRKDGTKRYVEASVSLKKDSSGKPVGFRGIARDITERKQAEETLWQEQQFSKIVLDNLPGVFYLCTYPKNRMVLWNKQGETLLGFNAEEIKGRHVTEWLPPEYREAVLKTIDEVMEKGQSSIEAPLMAKDGHQIPFFLTGVRFDVHEQIYFIGIGTDISERLKAEGALKKSELKYRNIFENAIEGIYQSTIEGRFITANAALARMAGYDSPEELIEFIKDIGTQLYVHPEDRKRFIEIRDTKGFVDGFEVEFYKKDGSKFWVVINARMVKDEQGEILYIEGLIEDITTRKHAEKQLHQTLERLKKAVDTTIQVLISAVESRDPYTAGHQLRVADLARAIATEMGLPQDKIEGIRMAGSIHDIGKLSIPAEILSKPTKLTNIEYSLIKEHPQIGYEMLKNVESPWPLAEIVYQHHECMNGSGYPRNLKGDEILMESRTLVVADVVEAMASHRPYRAALGIDAALAEIEKNKGIHYDNTVVDACLKLFREKGYQLK